MILLLVVTLAAVPVFSSLICPQLPTPKNSFPTSSGNYFPGNIVQFKCAKGYLFRDERSIRYTKCIYNRETQKTEWTTSRYLDQCYEHCNGCGDWGRCAFDDRLREFKCKCPAHFDGKKCERVVCLRPGDIANGYVANRQQVSTGKVPVNTEITYHCNHGYKILGLDPVLIVSSVTCIYNGLYYPNPPRCVPVENTRDKCMNEFHRKWISSEQTAMFKYPDMSKNKTWFEPGQSITLTCPKPTKMLDGHKNSKTLQCLTDGVWTGSWPLCKVPVCKWPVFPRGKTVSLFPKGRGMLVQGSHIVFGCNSPYHIFGDKYSTCLPDGEWSFIPECVTLQVFKNKCTYAGYKVEFQGYNHTEPVCVMTKNMADEAAKKQLKTITVVTSTAAVIFGILLIIVAGVAFQRRRLLSQIRRLQQNESEERDRSNLDNDVYGQFILPSYDQSQKDKPNTLPPSFDEALNEGQGVQNQEQELGAAAPPTSPLDPPPPPYDIRMDTFTFTSISSLTSASTSGESENGVYLDDVMLL